MKEEKRLLIIDDEENMRHMLSVVTTKAGYQVTMAENGEQALAIHQKSPFPFILCDLKMPKMDGLHFLKALNESSVSHPLVTMMSINNQPMVANISVYSPMVAWRSAPPLNQTVLVIMRITIAIN